MSDDRSMEEILEQIRYSAGRQQNETEHPRHRGPLLPPAALNRPELQTLPGDSRVRPVEPGLKVKK